MLKTCIDFDHSTFAVMVASVEKDMETRCHGMGGDHGDCSTWDQNRAANSYCLCDLVVMYLMCSKVRDLFFLSSLEMEVKAQMSILLGVVL